MDGRRRDLGSASGLDVGEGQATDLPNDLRAYADLLEVRWLLSERAGRDVGDEPALVALAHREAPIASAARMAVAETPTGQLPAVAPVVEPPDSSPAPSAWDL